jgi:hypothetical protein
MSDNKAVYFYAPVQHDGYIAVHAAEYDEKLTLVSVEPAEQNLRDMTQEHLVMFLSHVMVGVVNRPVVSPAEFAEKVRKA